MRNHPPFPSLLLVVVYPQAASLAVGAFSALFNLSRRARACALVSKMSLFTWCAQRAGGLSMIVLIALCYWVISRESTTEQHRYKYEQPNNQGTYYSSTSTTGAGIWTYLFSYYCLLIHVLVCVFPLRACWTVWTLTQSLKRAAQSHSLLDLKKLASRRDSYTSVSSSETLISSHNGGCSSTTSEAGDIDPELYTDGVSGAGDNVIHAIVIPNYKEEHDTLKETLEVLASHPQAQDSYDVGFLLCHSQLSRFL